jgi:uncharacterized protein
MRQVGKTTLARQYLASLTIATPLANYFDLEDPTDVARLDSPKLALESLRGAVVIDEVQRRPDLFPVLRVLMDRPDNPARFLILGSASPNLLRQSSESLAGRITFLEVNPFRATELPGQDLRKLWLRGGLPRSYLAGSEDGSSAWRKAYIRTFLERDLPELGIRIPPATLRRFWLMLAHYHGQTVNYSELSRSFGVSDATIRHYLDILSGAFVVRLLPPWFENLGKRQVRAPKLYIRDSGLLHALLGIDSEDALQVNPKLGASWEGFALEQILSVYRIEPEEAYFWGVHAQGELDLLLVRGGQRVGFEIKYTDRPQATRKHREFIELLGLERLEIVCPGKMEHWLEPKIVVRGLDRLHEMSLNNAGH